MKFKELLPTVAAIGLVGGTIGGCEKPLATDETCNEVVEGSRPVEGACLGRWYHDLDALREECGGQVTTVIESCGCGGTEAPVWACESDE